MSGDHHDAHPVPDEQRQAEAGLWPRRVSPAPSTPGEPPKCARCGREADARVHQVINGPGAEDAGRHNFTPGEPRTDSVSTGTKSAHPAPGEGTAWTDADRDRVWPEGWLKCPLHPDQHGDVYHSANWHEDRPPASGEGTRQRPGGWVDGIGWIAPFDALDGEDRIVHDWSERVIKVREDFFGYEQPHVVVVLRWADGTSPAPPAPLTRPDTAGDLLAELDAKLTRGIEYLNELALDTSDPNEAQRLDQKRAGLSVVQSWLPGFGYLAQPAPLTPTLRHQS